MFFVEFEVILNIVQFLGSALKSCDEFALRLDDFQLSKTGCGKNIKEL